MVDIRYGFMFPVRGVVFGYFLLLIAAGSFLLSLIIGFVLGLIALTIISASEGTEIDFQRSRYREYSKWYWIIKSGKWIKFEKIEKVFINRVKITSNPSSFWNYYVGLNADTFSPYIDGFEYKAFIKFSNGSKIPFMIRSNKKKLKNY